MEKTFTQEQIMKILDKCYTSAIDGIPFNQTSTELAEEYIKKYKTPKVAAKKLIKAQIVKCTTSGFITNIGGLIAMPIAIPANITSVLFVQMQMVAAIAYIGGYNPNNDEVKTLVYMCLAGISISDICKQVGIKFSNKVSLNLLNKIPGTLLTKINQKIGYRFITKFGQTGTINLGKAIPLVGGVVGGSFDFISTKTIANQAYTMFIPANTN